MTDSMLTRLRSGIYRKPDEASKLRQARQKVAKAKAKAEKARLKGAEKDAADSIDIASERPRTLFLISRAMLWPPS